MGRSLSKPSHPKTTGTLYDTVEKIQSFGASGIPLKVDMHDCDAVVKTFQKALYLMNGVDILINNASVLILSSNPTNKQLELLSNVNTKATMIGIDACKSDLRTSNGSIVTVSPPLHWANLEWISRHPAYTISKYSMTLATLGAASDSIRANCLWPRHTVSTSATKRLEDEGYDNVYSMGRQVEDVARAICELSTSNLNAQVVYDDEIVALPSTQAPLDVFARPCTKQLRKH